MWVHGIYGPKLLILASHFLLRALIMPVHGAGDIYVMNFQFPTMEACSLAGSEISDALAPDRSASWVCSSRGSDYRLV
jgi:hypothetical protein